MASGNVVRMALVRLLSGMILLSLLNAGIRPAGVTNGTCREADFMALGTLHDKLDLWLNPSGPAKYHVGPLPNGVVFGYPSTTMTAQGGEKIPFPVQYWKFMELSGQPSTQQINGKQIAIKDTPWYWSFVVTDVAMCRSLCEKQVGHCDDDGTISQPCTAFQYHEINGKFCWLLRDLDVDKCNWESRCLGLTQCNTWMPEYYYTTEQIRQIGSVTPPSCGLAAGWYVLIVLLLIVAFASAWIWYTEPDWIWEMYPVVCGSKPEDDKDVEDGAQDKDNNEEASVEKPAPVSPRSVELENMEDEKSEQA